MPTAASDDDRPVVFRRAGAGDVGGLHDLIERAYRGVAARRGWTHEADLLDGQRTDAQALTDILADPRQRMILTERDGRPVACARVVATAPDGAEIGMLSVDPDRQAGSLGRSLLAEAERVAVQAFDARWIELTVIVQRLELIAWYERRGYRPTGERRPFPSEDPRFGLPRRADLAFAVLKKDLD